MPAGLLSIIQLLLLLPLVALLCSKKKKPAGNPNEVLPPAAGAAGKGVPGSAEKKVPSDGAVDVEP